MLTLAGSRPEHHDRPPVPRFARARTERNPSASPNCGGEVSGSMARTPSTATRNRRRTTTRRSRRQPRRHVRRGAPPARRRRRSRSVSGRPGRAVQRAGTPERGPPATASAIHDLLGPLARLLGVAPPRGLTGLLGALPRANGRTRALVASSLLWMLLYAGRQSGVLDAEASVWLSLGVVVAALYAVGAETQRPSAPRHRRPPSPPIRDGRAAGPARAGSRRYRPDDASR